MFCVHLSVSLSQRRWNWIICGPAEVDHQLCGCILQPFCGVTGSRKQDVRRYECISICGPFHFAVAQGPWSQCTSSLHKLFQSFPSSIGKCRGRGSGEILGGGGLGGGRVQQDSDSFPLLFDFWRLCTHCQLWRKVISAFLAWAKLYHWLFHGQLFDENLPNCVWW